MPALHPDREMERKEWRMRKIDLIVIHCTATREDKSLSPAELDRMHRQRGIAYEGGLDAGGNPADTRTEEQKRSIRVLVRVLCEDYRIRKVVGHRDLSPDRDGDGVVEPEEWIKLCPCYDVESDLAEQK